MPVGGDFFDQVHEPGRISSCGVDREEDDIETLFFRELCRLDRELDRPLQRPLVRVPDDVLTARDLHHDATDTAVYRAFYVIDHTAREGEYLGRKVALDDGLDGS